MRIVNCPSEQTWLMARIAALLVPYYEKDTPQGVRNIEAEDWAVELGSHPKWAVEKAVRWWKSEANPDRRKRPLEGDIAARCKRETDAVRAATRVLGSPVKPIPQPEPASEVSDADREHRARVVAEIMKGTPFVSTTGHGMND